MACETKAAPTPRKNPAAHESGCVPHMHLSTPGSAFVHQQLLLLGITAARCSLNELVRETKPTTVSHSVEDLQSPALRQLSLIKVSKSVILSFLKTESSLRA